MDKSRAALCETRVSAIISKVDGVLETISSLFDLYVGNNPLVIKVAIELKV